jgi:hypothetical protein
VRSKPWGRKARLITNVTGTALGKEEMAVRLIALWQIDALLGNIRGISKYTTAVTE